MRPINGGGPQGGGGGAGRPGGMIGLGSGMSLGLGGLASWIMSQKNNTNNMSMPDVGVPNILSDVFNRLPQSKPVIHTFPRSSSKAPQILITPKDTSANKPQILITPKDTSANKPLILPNPITIPASHHIAWSSVSNAKTRASSVEAAKRSYDRTLYNFANRAIKRAEEKGVVYSDDEKDILRNTIINNAKNHKGDLLSYQDAYAEIVTNPEYAKVIKSDAAYYQKEKERLTSLIEKTKNQRKSTKALKEELKTLEKHNPESRDYLARAHDPAADIASGYNLYLSGERRLFEGITVTSKKANDLDNIAKKRFDKLTPEQAAVEFPDGYPDTWDKILNWGAKYSRSVKEGGRYYGRLNARELMRNDYFLTHLTS